MKLQMTKEEMEAGCRGSRRNNIEGIWKNGSENKKIQVRTPLYTPKRIRYSLCAEKMRVYYTYC